MAPCRAAPIRELQARRARMEGERAQAKAERLKESQSLDEGARDRLMAAFETERAAVETKLEQARLAQSAKLEAQLQERRQRKLALAAREASEARRRGDEAAAARVAAENAAARSRIQKATEVVSAGAGADGLGLSLGAGLGAIMTGLGAGLTTSTQNLISASSGLV